MGIASLGGLMSGAGNVGTAGVPAVSKAFNGLFDTYLGSAGGIYDTEAQFKPQYTALNLQNLGSTLNGVNGAPGLIDLYTQAQGAGRAANYADLRRLDPNGAALMDQLNQSASQGLAAGGTLAPGDVYNITSGVRSDWANRGFAPNGNAQLDEAVKLATAGEGLRSTRQNFAQGVAGLNQNQYGLLSGTNIPELAMGLNQTSGPTLYNSNQAGNLLSSIYGGKNAAKMATAANNTGLYQSMDANQSSFISSL
jgi:hypothetical protein